MAKKNFYIPQIKKDDEEAPKNQKKKNAGFISPIYGKHVKDQFTYHGTSYGNQGRQYDIFRDEDERVKKDDFSEYLVKVNPDDLYSKTNSELEGVIKSNSQTTVVRGRNATTIPDYVALKSLEEKVTEEVDDLLKDTKTATDDFGFNSSSEPKEFTSSFLDDDVDYTVKETPSKTKEDTFDENFTGYDEEGKIILDPTPDYSRYLSTQKKPERQTYVEETTPIYDKDPVEVTIPLKKEYKPRDEEQSKTVRSVGKKRRTHYVFPPLDLLHSGRPVDQNDLISGILKQKEIINNTLVEFGIGGSVVNYTPGPTVTQYEIQLDPGVKMNRITAINSNIMANLRAKSIRIEAPIPGKSTVGIEVPNAVKDLVFFGELLKDPKISKNKNPLTVVLGTDIGGENIFPDVSKMPHCLIAGTTGSGKSVCINSFIMSMLYRAHPDDLKMILVDPKFIELSSYSDIPHLATPVITDAKVATQALNWASKEMDERYKIMATVKARNIVDYNELTKSDRNREHLPYIVIIVDEFADLMSTATGNDVELYVQRIAQKGRAAGIHLILATQRPSVDVIRGTIKGNIPNRIAFMVNSQVDSSIILDQGGAEKLLGQGDMLYFDSRDTSRIQGAFVSNEEIRAVTEFISANSEPDYIISEEELNEPINTGNSPGIAFDAANDELFVQIASFVMEQGSASMNKIQKTFGIGFNRAQNIIQAMEDLGIISENLGSRAREVLVSPQEFEEIISRL